MKNIAFEPDLAIVGGGASGLAAAVAAARALGNGARIAVFDAQPRCGKKLLATGNGRCNITNRGAALSHYRSDDMKTLSRVLETVGVDDTLRFFESIGLECSEEDEGRIYPRCGQASAVLDLLRLELKRLNVSEVCSCQVESIERKDNGFLMSSPLGTISADKVIVSCGGRAAPNLGGVEWGYDLLRSLGHSVTRTVPSLCPLPVESPHLGSLKGVRATARASLCNQHGVIFTDSGEVQFGDRALSGIVIFQLSSTAAEAGEKGLYVLLDMLPEKERETLAGDLLRRRKTLGHLTLENYLTGVFHKRVGMCILKEAGMSPLSRSVAELSEGDVRRIAAVIKEWRFPVSGRAQWNSAQVTHGGAKLSGFDGEDMQSRICEGLYAAGEVLDVDGLCGGYNLQWAWSSGILAGRSAAESIKKNQGSKRRK